MIPVFSFLRIQPLGAFSRKPHLLAMAFLASTCSAAAQDAPAASDTGFWSDWFKIIRQARDTQPAWSSPLVTTTGLLEDRLRVDGVLVRAGNGTDTAELDQSRGLALTIGPATEIQLGAPSYIVRQPASGPQVDGFSDWPIVRLHERLASKPQDEGDYVLTALLQVQAPTGRRRLTNDAWVIAPTLASGKGWGNFDIQATVSAALPLANSETLGHPLQTNIAFQYHTGRVFWPEVEASWTYSPDGRRAGLHQVFLTTGLVLGRFQISDHVLFTTGAGYEFAVAPAYRARPLTPAFDRGWRVTTRFNFL